MNEHQCTCCNRNMDGTCEVYGEIEFHVPVDCQYCNYVENLIEVEERLTFDMSLVENLEAVADGVQ